MNDKTQQRKSHGIPFNRNAQYARCVNELVVCSECEKPRVMYAARKVHFRDIEYPKTKLEMAVYMWGSSLQDLCGPEDPVMSRIFVRVNLSCSDPVEIPYYSSEAFVDLCIHCGIAQDLATGKTDIYLTCATCLHKHPKLYKWKCSCVAGPGQKRRASII